MVWFSFNRFEVANETVEAAAMRARVSFML